MADIDLQRKSSGGMGWLWALLAIVLLALIVWWIWPDADEDAVVEPVETMETVEPETPVTTPESMAGDIPGISVADILENPETFIGEEFPGAEVTAVEVPTDRGFWIEDEGARLFAIIIDRPEEQPKDINPGATLRIDDGTLHDASFLPEMPGAPLDERTQTLAEQQDIFLVVDERYIEVLEGGQPQPGTDPAQGVQPGQEGDDGEGGGTR